MPRILLLLGAVVMIAGCSLQHPLQSEPANASAERAGPEQADLMQAYKSAAADVHGKPVLKVLPNGLQVLIKQDKRFPLTAVRLYVHAGSGYENPAEAGISHLLEHMVFKGTARRGPGESAEAVEAVGGQLNAATSYDYTVYHAETPSDHWTVGLDVVTDMAFHAAIPPKELASERKVVLSELARGEDNPNSRLFKTLTGMAWEGTPYEWPIIGYKDTVASITDEDVVRYIDRLYQPQSMLLVIVGDVDPDEAFEEARKACGDLANDRVVDPAEPFGVPELEGPVIQTVPGQWNKVYLAAAFPTPGSGSAELPALEVLAHVMGGDETSRLYRECKYERGLVDDVSMSALSLERGGLLYVHATLDAADVEEFLQVVSEQLANLGETGFTREEIQRAKLNLSDSLFLSKETLSGLASKLGYFQFFEGGYAQEQAYLFNLSQVDAAELRRIGREYVRPSQLALAVLPPEDADLGADSLEETIRKAWPASPPAEPAAAETAALPAEEIALDGGSKVILLPDATLPYTGLSIYWSGGDGLLDASQQGLAQLTARALTRGTANRSATALEDYLSDRAASLAASAGRETFHLNAKYPARFGADMLALVRDVLLHPAFAEDEVQRARSDQVSAIRRRQDRPLGLAFRRVFPFLFTDAPYSYLHEGTAEAVAGYGPGDIRQYWDRQRERPFVLAVCGQVDREEVLEFARSLEQAMTPEQQPYRPPEAVYAAEQSENLVLPERNQAHVLALFPAPGKESPDTPGLEVLRSVLAGQSGLLFRDLRDKQGLGYSVTAFLWQASRAGFMAFYIGTTPDTVDQALEGFRETAAELAEAPLDAEELARARNQISGEYYLQHQSLLSRSREAASLVSRGFDRQANRREVEQAKTVDAEELMRLARQYLDWDQVRILKVTP